MRPMLDSYGIELVAISANSPDQASRQRERDRLSLTLLSDRDRTAIRSYGLAITHMRYVTWFHDVLPVGIPTGFSAIAIPTSILVDKRGVIQWIDSATDYRIRSDRDRIELELLAAFGPADRTNR